MRFSMPFTKAAKAEKNSRWKLRFMIQVFSEVREDNRLSIAHVFGYGFLATACRFWASALFQAFRQAAVFYSANECSQDNSSAFPSNPKRAPFRRRHFRRACLHYAGRANPPRFLARGTFIAFQA